MLTIDYSVIVIPAIISYAVIAKCPMKKSDKTGVKIDPIVFKIVWPILFLCLGVAWYKTLKVKSNKLIRNGLFTLVSVGFGLWLYFYNCKNNKQVSMIILVSILASLMALRSLSPPEASVLLSPVSAWIVFAIVLSVSK